MLLLVLLVLVPIFILFLVWFWKKFKLYVRGGNRISRRFFEKSDLSGRICIVTGSSAGIGLETARALAKLGGKIILACRNEEKTKKVIQRILKETTSVKSEQLVFLHLDLDDLESVRRFCEKVKEKYEEIHILVNNGIGTSPPRESKQGFLSMIQINYLAPFLLTNLLMTQIIKGNGRIVNVGSVGHYIARSKHLDYDYSRESSTLKDYYFFRYCLSKLLLLVFTKALAKRLRNIKKFQGGVVCLHPGGIKTAIFDDEVFLFYKYSVRCMTSLTISPELGCQTTLLCCLMPNIKEVSGKYFSNCQEVRGRKVAESEKWQSSVWKQSEKYVNESFNFEDYQN